jgi:hypothetical protein
VNITPPTSTWLSHVFASEWIADGSNTPGRPIMMGTNHVRFVEFSVPLHVLDDRQTQEEPEKTLSFNLVRDGWKVTTLYKYRPLVYYAAFGAREIFACLRLSIESLLTCGKWSHDILVMTSPAYVVPLREELDPLALGERLHIAMVPGEDALDWCCARYRLDASPLFQTAQPLVYLDTDIICDHPIDDLMVSLVRSNSIQFKAEGEIGEGGPESDGRWFGWRFLEADGVPFDPRASGFSSGAIGFANAAMAHTSFDAILKSAYGFAAVTGNRHYYDQPFANYVLRKQGRFATDILDPVLMLCRTEPGRHDPPDAQTATGLVHFTGGVGVAAPKWVAMENYLNLLLSRRDASSPDASPPR